MDVESVVDEGPGLAFIVYPEVDELFFLISKVLYSEKAKKFCEIFLLLFTVCTVVKRGLHTGVDKLYLYRKRKTVSSKGGDKLEGNLGHFS